MITPTITEIKVKTAGTSPYFFNHSTLKFWGQSMRSFRVRKSPQGRIFIYAPMYMRQDSGGMKQIGYTFREFTGNNLEQIRDEEGKIIEHDRLDQIDSYIATH